MAPEENIDETGYTNILAPQNFVLPILMGISSVILSYSYFSPDINRMHFTFSISCILSLYVLFSLKKYLKNFVADKAIYWLNWYYITSIVATAIMVFLYIVSALRSHPATHREHQALQVFFAFIFAALLLILVCTYFITISIKLGNALRDIPNDFIGLLHRLGTWFSYVIPTMIVIMILLTFVRSLRHNMLIRFVQHTIFIFPLIIITMIFYKAHKYRLEQIANDESL